MGELKLHKYIAKYIIIYLYKNIYVLLAIKNYWVEGINKEIIDR